MSKLNTLLAKLEQKTELWLSINHGEQGKGKGKGTYSWYISSSQNYRANKSHFKKESIWFKEHVYVVSNFETMPGSCLKMLDHASPLVQFTQRPANIDSKVYFDSSIQRYIEFYNVHGPMSDPIYKQLLYHAFFKTLPPTESHSWKYISVFQTRTLKFGCSIPVPYH